MPHGDRRWQEPRQTHAGRRGAGSLPSPVSCTATSSSAKDSSPLGYLCMTPCATSFWVPGDGSRPGAQPACSLTTQTTAPASMALLQARLLCLNEGSRSHRQEAAQHAVWPRAGLLPKGLFQDMRQEEASGLRADSMFPTHGMGKGTCCCEAAGLPDFAWCSGH